MSYTDGIGRLPPVSGTNAAKPVQPVPVSDDQSPQAGSSASPTDHADLSAASGLIAKSLAGSDARTAKVEALQQAIASGNYRISSADIADKMIQSLLEK